MLPEAAQRGFRLADPFPGWHRRGRAVVPGAERLVRVDPDLDGTDGFFIALFVRTEEEGGREGGLQGAAAEVLHEPTAAAAAGAMMSKAGSAASGRAGKGGGARGPAPAAPEPALDAKAKHRKLKRLGPGSSDAGAGMQVKDISR